MALGSEENQVSKEKSPYLYIAQALETIPGYKATIERSGYVEMKLLQGLAGALGRDVLETRDQVPPSLPADGLLPSPETKAQYTAEWLMYDLRQTGQTDLVHCIQDVGFNWKKLGDTAKSAGSDIKDVWGKYYDAGIRMFQEKPPTTEEEQVQLMSQARNEAVSGLIPEARGRVSNAIENFVGSMKEMLMHGAWWNDVIRQAK